MACLLRGLWAVWLCLWPCAVCRDLCRRRCLAVVAEELGQVAEGPHRLFAGFHAFGDGDDRFGWCLGPVFWLRRSLASGRTLSSGRAFATGRPLGTRRSARLASLCGLLGSRALRSIAGAGLVGFRLLAAAFSAGALCARLDHGQRHATALFIHTQHPNLDDVAHGDHFVRIADETVGQLADVDQSAVVHSDVDERPEVHHVEDRAGQLHAGFKIFKFQHALFEDGGRQVFARSRSRRRR